MTMNKFSAVENNIVQSKFIKEFRDKLAVNR